MADSNFISEVTAASFEVDVLTAAQEHPVLIDFWAPWCGPCQSLTPILEKLVTEYAGAFTLAKINADDEQALAGQFGVRSLPTVALMFKDEILDHFIGAKPEGEIRAMLEKHIGPAGEAEQPEPAPIAIDPSDPAQAITALREALTETPDNADLKAQLAGALATAGDLDEARVLLAALSDDERSGETGKAAAARLEFADALVDAPAHAVLHERLAAAPDDLQNRYWLAARNLLAGQYDAGLEQLLEIMRRDRTFDDDLGRRGLLSAYAVVDDAVLVTSYRSRMTSLLF